MLNAVKSGLADVSSIIALRQIKSFALIVFFILITHKINKVGKDPITWNELGNWDFFRIPSE